MAVASAFEAMSSICAIAECLAHLPHHREVHELVGRLGDRDVGRGHASCCCCMKGGVGLERFEFVVLFQNVPEGRKSDGCVSAEGLSCE